MKRWPLYRTVLALLALGALVGGVVFVGALATALYYSVFAGEPAFMVLFFMSGLPLFSGASAVLLGFSVRSHIQKRGSRGTCLMAFYAVAYVGVITLVALQALYAPGS